MGLCIPDVAKLREERRLMQEEYVLTVLNSKGINTEEFKNSELYCFALKNVFINHLYNVLHSHKYDEHGYECKIDLNKLEITFKNDILEVNGEDINYKYCVINGHLSVDGESIYPVFVASGYVPAVSLEVAIRAMKQMHEDLKAYEDRRIDALEKSWEFAKTFKIK